MCLIWIQFDPLCAEIWHPYQASTTHLGCIIIIYFVGGKRFDLQLINLYWYISYHIKIWTGSNEIIIIYIIGIYLFSLRIITWKYKHSACVIGLLIDRKAQCGNMTFNQVPNLSIWKQKLEKAKQTKPGNLTMLWRTTIDRFGHK